MPIVSWKHGISAEDCIVGMEATGHYWLAFYSFLVNHGFDIKVINPIMTDGYRNMLVRKVKNDTIDSQIIHSCRYDREATVRSSQTSVDQL